MDSNFTDIQEMTARHREEKIKEANDTAKNYVNVSRQPAVKRQAPKTEYTKKILISAKVALATLLAVVTIGGSIKYAQALHQSDENMMNGAKAFTDKMVEIKEENLALGRALTNEQIMEQAVRELEEKKEASNGGRSNG